jgi:hypothetical protein
MLGIKYKGKENTEAQRIEIIIKTASPHESRCGKSAIVVIICGSWVGKTEPFPTYPSISDQPLRTMRTAEPEDAKAEYKRNGSPSSCRGHFLIP